MQSHVRIPYSYLTKYTQLHFITKCSVDRWHLSILTLYPPIKLVSQLLAVPSRCSTYPNSHRDQTSSRRSCSGRLDHPALRSIINFLCNDFSFMD